MSTAELDDKPVTVDPTPSEIDLGEEEERRRLEAMRRMPTRAQLLTLIANRKPSSINYYEEDDELPC